MLLYTELPCITQQVRELKDDELIVKQKALLAARELLGSPIGYMQCIAAGITPAIVKLLSVSTVNSAADMWHIHRNAMVKQTQHGHDSWADTPCKI